MAETFVESPAETADNFLQLVAAILLGLAATFTAVSAYESAQMDGAALKGYTNSTRTLNDANAFYGQGNQTTAMDQQLFIAYATASHEGNDKLARYLKTMMRPELKGAIRWWKKSGTTAPPLDPSVQANPYDVEDFDQAWELEHQASHQYKAAVRADNRGGKFQLSTVLFALTLFFGGISTLFRRKKVSHGLLMIGAVTLVAGVIELARAFLA
ncbi:MAG: hypothetical protein ACJ71Z_04690 [Aeromicrobium sp.]